jgi:GNAT superfamily N-acetyltransferase
MTKGDTPDAIRLTGYYPGVIGKVIELHAVYYHENWGFDLSFETQVGRELSEFVGNVREKRDGFWAAVVDEAFAGAVAIDGAPAGGEGARLRWFIVDPEFQGRGLGSLLLTRALDFCREAGHRKIFLWTFKGLNRARLLYERAGFRLAEEHRVRQWGDEITEQKFELLLKDA